MTYSIPPWILVLVGLAGLGFGLFGIWLHRRNARLGKRGVYPLAGVAACAFVLVFLLPTLIVDRVTIDDTSLSRRMGFWFNPTTVSVPLAGVDSVRIEARTSRNARGRTKYQTVWVFFYDDGATAEMEAGDLMDSAQDDLVQRLQARGIIVEHGRG